MAEKEKKTDKNLGQLLFKDTLRLLYRMDDNRFEFFVVIGFGFIFVSMCGMMIHAMIFPDVYGGNPLSVSLYVVGLAVIVLLNGAYLRVSFSQFCPRVKVYSHGIKSKMFIPFEKITKIYPSRYGRDNFYRFTILTKTDAHVAGEGIGGQESHPFLRLPKRAIGRKAGALGAGERIRFHKFHLPRFYKFHLLLSVLKEAFDSENLKTDYLDAGEGIWVHDVYPFLWALKQALGEKRFKETFNKHYYIKEYITNPTLHYTIHTDIEDFLDLVTTKFEKRNGGIHVKFLGCFEKRKIETGADFLIQARIYKSERREEEIPFWEHVERHPEYQTACEYYPLEKYNIDVENIERLAKEHEKLKPVRRFNRWPAYVWFLRWVALMWGCAAIVAVVVYYLLT